MAIREKALRYIEEILSIDGKKYKDLQICCIGRLNTQKDSRQFMRNRGERGVDTMRGYFVKHGAICEEIDLNPKGDTVFHYDLGRPITDEKLQNRFDFVLDGGTGEHIDNQFEFYSNIFRIMKVGGLAIHILPVRGFWDGHSTWNYDMEWVYKFANRAKYQVIDVRQTSDMLWYNKFDRNVLMFALKKTEETFIDKGKFKNPHYEPQGDITNKKMYNRFVLPARAHEG